MLMRDARYMVLPGLLRMVFICPHVILSLLAIAIGIACGASPLDAQIDLAAHKV